MRVGWSARQGTVFRNHAVNSCQLTFVLVQNESQQKTDHRMPVVLAKFDMGVARCLWFMCVFVGRFSLATSSQIKLNQKQKLTSKTTAEPRSISKSRAMATKIKTESRSKSTTISKTTIKQKLKQNKISIKIETRSHPNHSKPKCLNTNIKINTQHERKSKNASKLDQIQTLNSNKIKPKSEFKPDLESNYHPRKNNTPARGPKQCAGWNQGG